MDSKAIEFYESVWQFSDISFTPRENVNNVIAMSKYTNWFDERTKLKSNACDRMLFFLCMKNDWFISINIHEHVEWIVWYENWDCYFFDCPCKIKKKVWLSVLQWSNRKQYADWRSANEKSIKIKSNENVFLLIHSVSRREQAIYLKDIRHT